MDSPGCEYDGEKIYRRVVEMGGRNQDKFFHWILTVVVAQCNGFTGMCVCWGGGLWMGGREGQEPG